MTQTITSETPTGLPSQTECSPMPFGGEPLRDTGYAKKAFSFLGAVVVGGSLVVLSKEFPVESALSAAGSLTLAGISHSWARRA